MLEVTIKFKDHAQFEGFLSHNKIESYTWNKGKISIDLSGIVDQAMTDLPDRTKAIESSQQTASVVDDFA